MALITVTIRKPLYGNYCYIQGVIVEKAIRLGDKMRINIPAGSAIVDPNDWKKDCKVMEKVFNFADHPMILYGNYVKLPKPKGEVFTSSKEKEAVEEEKKKQLSLL